ncbi:Methylthioribose-1-phosphate isomerase [Posidoniimonas polymericola]|uniref:Methylthioribose-1-phosphate isomerase n=1 Tax=Posidoniimonas polymericola TaxID=2528002 RepID=A0A5C5YSW3_9BACT|nr:S-methyl-5-thioribose-1-phosphate isomerase [Posidoniimonas polymericola]TWT78082.1 Methylthioribose-1-phosphate isomerase [Posidoniimonas polymericola]
MANTIEWIGDAGGFLRLLDQTKLPTETTYLDCRTVEDVWQAIKRLSVRGAPAIGVSAAYGVCLDAGSKESALAACDYLATSRPTAVNLFWALDRIRHAIEKHEASRLVASLLEEAKAIHAEDHDLCAAIGRHGADALADLPTGAGVLTHCNTGALATGGDGTALAVILELHRRGHEPKVYADETRPLLQGARLTMWELMERGVDATLITDSMNAQVMREGRVGAVIVGADRIAANGDAANKIGTYAAAIAARYHKVPFYVAAPSTTFDLTLTSGDQIPIEQRADEEITCGFGKQTAPVGAKTYNPAFDVTPAELITGIVTERGVFKPGEVAAALSSAQAK